MIGDLGRRLQPKFARYYTAEGLIYYIEGMGMIEVTKLNGVKILVNPHLLEIVEETPDTVITLTTGKKIIV